jgi:hypothetical protein
MFEVFLTFSSTLTTWIYYVYIYIHECRSRKMSLVDWNPFDCNNITLTLISRPDKNERQLYYFNYLERVLIPLLLIFFGDSFHKPWSYYIRSLSKMLNFTIRAGRPNLTSMLFYFNKWVIQSRMFLQALWSSFGNWKQRLSLLRWPIEFSFCGLKMTHIFLYAMSYWSLGFKLQNHQVLNRTTMITDLHCFRFKIWH